MVHVQVEEVEGLVVGGRLSCKFSPGADADASRIPSKARAVGSLVEPEVAVIQQAQPVFLIEYRGIFPTLLAVVTAHADEVIAIQTLEHIDKLRVKHLLGAKDVGGHEIELVTHDLAALGPHLTIDAIAGDLEPDVISAHKHLGRQQLGGKHYKKRDERDFFHFIIICLRSQHLADAICDQNG